jgi:hypothetical protein
LHKGSRIVHMIVLLGSRQWEIPLPNTIPGFCRPWDWIISPISPHWIGSATYMNSFRHIDGDGVHDRDRVDEEESGDHQSRHVGLHLPGHGAELGRAFDLDFDAGVVGAEAFGLKHHQALQGVGADGFEVAGHSAGDPVIRWIGVRLQHECRGGEKCGGQDAQKGTVDFCSCLILPYVRRLPSQKAPGAGSMVKQRSSRPDFGLLSVRIVT